MKVKKRKEQWQAVKFEGAGIPEELESEFSYIEEEPGWNGMPYLTISKYNPDKRQWDEFTVQVGQYFLWSSHGRIKVLDQDTFEEKWEEA